MVGGADERRLRRAVLCAVLLGVLLRLALMLVLPQAPFSDGAWYVARADEIAAGFGYREDGAPTAFWPIGWPLLLAAGKTMTGNAIAGAMVLNLAAAAVTIWLVARVTRIVGGSHDAVAFAALLYALYPAHIAYAGTTFSETVATAIAVGAVALAVAARGRAAQLALAGLLFGAVALMRPQMLYFPVGLVIAAVLVEHLDWRRALASLAIVYAAIALVVAPVTLRNCRMLGACVTISTNGGVALRTGASDDATGGHLDWNAVRWEAEGVPFGRRNVAQVAADAKLRASALAWIAADPWRWAALMPVKAGLVWGKDGDGFWAMQASYRGAMRRIRSAQIVNQLFYMALLLLAVPALVAGLRGWWRGAPDQRLLYLFVMPAFVTLTAMVFTGQTRYHHAAMPFLIAAAAWTLARLRQRMTSRRGLAT